MKTLSPKLEIYKADQDVTAGDISGELVTELGQLFKKYGFFVRFLIQSDQEVEQSDELVWKLPGWLVKLRRLFKKE